MDNERQNEILKSTKSMTEMTLDKAEDEKSPEEFPVVQIQRKTICEERNWMKIKFNEVKKTARISDGQSLLGTTVETISKSVPITSKVAASCTIKLSNFLHSDLTDPQYRFWSGTTNSGPLRVAGQNQEVLTFMGGALRCASLCSFAVSPDLRLTIQCYNDSFEQIIFGIAFTPADVPIDTTLIDRLWLMSEVPDVWMHKMQNKIPQEVYVNHGNLLVRGHMTPWARSIVHVEILEMGEDNISKHSENEIKENIAVGKSIKSHPPFQNAGTITREMAGNSGRISCNIKIVNCLSVTLRNGTKYYCNCEKNDFIPFYVFPFEREIFFGADETNVEAMFSYTIESTDLAIVIAVKVQPNQNSFAAAFVQINALAITGTNNFLDLMDSNQWRIHNYRKYANAREGVQLIQMRNIRAEIQMTEEEHSFFKIRIFAI